MRSPRNTAADQKSPVTVDHFLEQRSEQILKRLTERTPSLKAFLTRPTLGHYVATPEALLHRAGVVLRAIVAGELSIRIGATFPLAEAAEAHRQLTGRATTGKVLLIP